MARKAAPPNIPPIPELQVTHHKRLYTLFSVLKHLYRVIEKEGSLTRTAEKIGVTKAFLSMVLRGRKLPGPKVLDYLGWEKHEIYTRTRRGRPIGASVDEEDGLEPEPGNPRREVETADPLPEPKPRADVSRLRGLLDG